MQTNEQFCKCECKMEMIVIDELRDIYECLFCGRILYVNNEVANRKVWYVEEKEK